MTEVAAVLHDLQPVAGQPMSDDLAEAVRPDEQVPARQQWRRLRAKVGPDQAAQLLHRVGLDAHLVLERAVWRLQRLFEAATFSVEQPAVVTAAQALIFGNAHGQAGHAVRTALPE